MQHKSNESVFATSALESGIFWFICERRTNITNLESGVFMLKIGILFEYDNSFRDREFLRWIFL